VDTKLGVELRSDESTSTVKLRLAYYNGRERVVD
jgi:hypothetical protein